MSRDKTHKHSPVRLVIMVFMILIIFGSVGITLLFKLPMMVPFSRLWGLIIGSILVGLGVYFYISGIWVLTPNRALGKDRSKEETENNLVTTGIYRYTRNPLYFGVILIFFGLFFLFLYTFLLLIALLFIILFYFISRWEEKELYERFGEEYLRYKESVPLFIPYPKKKHEEV